MSNYEKILDIISNTKNLDVSKIDEEILRKIGQENKIRIPWAKFKIFYNNDGKCDLSSVVNNHSVDSKIAAPQTSINIADNFVKTQPVNSIPVKSKKIQKKRQDPKELDKFTGMFPEKTDLNPTTQDTVIIVSDPIDNYVVGVAKSFEGAWKLKMRLFHDFGTFSDMNGAKKVFNEKNCVILKSSTSDNYCLIDKQELYK